MQGSPGARGGPGLPGIPGMKGNKGDQVGGERKLLVRMVGGGGCVRVGNKGHEVIWLIVSIG